MTDYIIIVGGNYYHGIGIFKMGKIVQVIKDYENSYDDELIQVYIERSGKVGYVANSTYTVAKGTKNARRIYDKFGKKQKQRFYLL
ncbi:HIRAN domain-containing protein [Anaerosalibacter massiliensis]|uniref:HIRAN domain-containing protein n=1 Tax=Anaerosalibacter massiliensis TaxID=1347392 RepID=A0A9X2MIJ2_9FIRM|nr:HIRAN domain-containing protein [Anaerosalibacter massiliensis]MCR2044171.1 HIRAN domain-containing protein [Anaerosalibacter massiliensis]